MEEKTAEYIIIPILVEMSVILSVRNYGQFGLLVFILSLVTAVLILLVGYADFFVFPLVTSLLRIRMAPANGYTIPRSQDCVIKNVNKLYYATGYLTANIYSYVFSTEQVLSEDAQLMAAPEKWEKIVMNINFPFKFHLLTCAKEIQNYREDLEGKRSYIEFEISKEMQNTAPDQFAVDELQRKKNVVQARIDRLSSGERPVGCIMYIETVAVGVTENAATDALNNQISQLQASFNSMDLSIARVMGREVYVLFKLGYRLPTTRTELESLFFVEK